MSKRKINDDGIYFTGQSSVDVTGSQYLIKFDKYKCLLECGLHQSKSNSFLDSYKINSKKFEFDPKEIDYLFLGHAHIDHCGLIPRLVAKGFQGKIISTTQTFEIAKSLLLNSCHIIAQEAEILSRKYKREYKPLYEVQDVINTLELFETYDDYNKLYSLNNMISFQWLKNSHCIGAAQLQLIFKNDIKTKKILYTSDLGSLSTQNHYLENSIIPEMFNDVVIMEGTYGDRKPKNKTRDFDKRHLEAAIETTLGNKGTVIFPCFSFSRTQEILTTLYEIWGNSKNFKTPIYIDSKLSCEISKLYNRLLIGDNYKKWNKVFNWSNLNLITEKLESKACINDLTPKIVISSSGFCTNGRVLGYLKKYLSDRNSMIVFCGYTGDNPSYLSYRIKNYREHKFIKICQENIKNLANCISLYTYSSHADRNDLIKYGSNLNTNLLVLVHASNDSKLTLLEILKKEISKNNKSYKVVPSNLGLKIKL